MNRSKYDTGFLPRLRAWTRHAWFIHGVLISSLILGPNPTGHAVPIQSFDVFNSEGNFVETRQFEDWNNNQVHDSEENSWVYDSQDGDSDGLLNAREVLWQTDPYNPDSDYDGISDGNEMDLLGGLAGGFNPTSWDSDSDGFSDHDELYNFYGVHYPTLGLGVSYFDWDGDGVKNHEDSHPQDATLSRDYDNDGVDDAPSNDWDGDGYVNLNDSDPYDPTQWNDWNDNGINDDPNGDDDLDGTINQNDSHPDNPSIWNDWNHNGIPDDPQGDDDGDGVINQNDSHPDNVALSYDWDNNGFNDDPNGDDDGDGVSNQNDSHPYAVWLWNDWNNSGYNDDNEPPPDSDGDGYADNVDSDPSIGALWSDVNPRNGINDENESGLTDVDGDTRLDQHDSDPQNGDLWNDRSPRNGINDEEDPDLDSDADGYPDRLDSDPNNINLWDDVTPRNGINDNDETGTTNVDGDDYLDQDDSHPLDPLLWNDRSPRNGINDDPNGNDDGDERVNQFDSHPDNHLLWNDFDPRDGHNDLGPPDNDFDGHPDNEDTHPYDGNLWNDHNGNFINDHDEPPVGPTDSDNDTRPDASDSHPHNPLLWNDYEPSPDGNGINDDPNGNDDGDPWINSRDSHPYNATLWNDFSPANGVNDQFENDGQDGDGDEYNNEDDSHPNDPDLYTDWDLDNLNEEDEILIGSDPDEPDSDNDGLFDGDEHFLYHTLATNVDTDGDGRTDFEELRISPYSNPLDKWSRSKLLGLGTHLTDFQLSGAEVDTDGDHIPDPVERAYGLDPEDPADAGGDLDADMITNVQEYMAGTSLWGNNDIYDADDDGMTDLEEDLGNLWYPGTFDRHQHADATEDPDGDGLLNYEELELGLNPVDADSSTPNFTIHSGSGVSGDMAYVIATAHPTWTMPVTVGDTDGDGMTDVWEHFYRSRGGMPGLQLRDGSDWELDTDGDGLINRLEVLSFRHPLVQDYVAPPVTPGTYNPGTSVNSPYTQPIVSPVTPGSGGNFNVEHIVSGTGGDAEENPLIETQTTTFTNDYSAGVKSGWKNDKEYVEASGKSAVTARACSDGNAPLPTGPGQRCACFTHSTPNRFRGLSVDEGGEAQQIEGIETPDDITDDRWSAGGTILWSWQLDDEVLCDLEDDPDDGDLNPSLPTQSMSAEMRIMLPQPSSQTIRRRVRITHKGDPAIEPEITYKMLEVSAGDTTSETLTEYAFGYGNGGVSYVRLEIPDDSVDDGIGTRISASDGTGPRYRKVGLNGVPMPDAKPQVQNENGELNEETYVDSFLAQLRHSVSDVYVTDDTSLLPLQVRRDVTSDSWSDRSGLRPWERPFQPFGPGWGTNVCSYVQFSMGGGGRIDADVVDEMGSHQRYIYLPIPGGGGAKSWFHDRQELQDVKTSQHYFQAVVVPGTPDATGFHTIQLLKKFGTKCYYEVIPSSFLSPKFSRDRVYGSTGTEYQYYARLTKVEDRWGNELLYQYPDYTSLIPHLITDPQRPGHQISIRQQGGRIMEVRAPNGDSTLYNYTDLVVPYRSQPSTTHSGSVKVLESVVRGGHTVSYDQLLTHTTETDSTGRQTKHSHLELRKITDERGNDYVFNYTHNTTIYYSGSEGRKMQYGLPMKLTSVTSPITGTVSISNTRVVDAELLNGYDYRAAAKPVTTTFSYGSGATARSYTYKFSEPIGTTVKGAVAKENPGSMAVSYSFKLMEITSPDGGKESYRFNAGANMALQEVTDRNGNKTAFFYTDPVALSNVMAPDMGRVYDDPTQEVNALGQTKTFTYDRATRILKSVTDSRKVKTEYTIDQPTASGAPYGRRKKEKVGGMVGGKEETLTYGHSLLGGFVTQRILNVNAADVNRPAVAVCPPLVTNYSLGTNVASPGWWRQVTETREVDGVPHTTLTISDLNGNKRSVTDGRGFTTSFSYDGSNRLTGVQFPDGSSKSMEYDPHGNLTKEVDETGRTVIHAYDALNRRVSSTVDLNGNGIADSRSAGDLVEETTYNDLNLPVTQTNARGIVTRYEYDAIGRPVKVIANDGAADAADRQVTVSDYKVAGLNNGNEVGSSVFDISGFKPVRLTDPEGRVATFKYDKLYRLIEQSGTDAGTVKTTYAVKDSSSNPATVSHRVDPLRLTHFTYDAQGRAIKTLHPDGTSSQTFYTHHGQPWKTVNEQGKITLTRFDAAGRVKAVESPAVAGVTAITTTGYDLAGNTEWVKDALGRVTSTAYDRRNRPTFVTLPEVVDAGDAQQVLRHPVTETRYDACGRVTVAVDPLGYETKKFYDRAGRATHTEDALGNVTSMTYDPAGNVLTTTNAKGQQVTNLYDAFNRLVHTTDHSGIVNEFKYDKAGNRTQVKDGRGKISSFTYDGQNRVKTQVFQGSLTSAGTAAQDVWTNTYNAAVKLSETDPAGNITTYTYDDRDRLDTVSTPALGAVAANVRTFSYDACGRMLSVTESSNSAAGVVYTYDALGWQTSETARGVTHTYQYDKVGNRVQANYGDGRRTVTGYDALNRPLTISEGPSATFEADKKVTGYGYDLAGRALQLTVGNGQVTRNTYDALGRLTARVLHQATPFTEANRQARFNWLHDDIGNVTQQTEQWFGTEARTRVTVLGYDGTNRLLDEEITETGAQTVITTYAYDAGNNRTSKEVIAGGSGTLSTEVGHWTYVFNDANQLVTTEKRQQIGGAITGTVTYLYDARGNRVRRELGLDQTATASSQGISYRAAAPGEAGNELGIQLLAGAAGRPAAGVQVVGPEVKVTLAMDQGLPASRTSQGMTFTAAQAGIAGNDLTVRLSKAGAGEELSAAVQGNEVVVKLETDDGIPNSLVNQGITYTDKKAPGDGPSTGIALSANEPDQTANVLVVDGDIAVKLATDSGDKASASLQGLTYQAVTAGSSGNDLQVSYQLANANESASATLVGNQLQVRLEQAGAVAASLEQGGLTYTATNLGTAGNDITVTHTLGEEGEPLLLTATSTGVTVRLARDGGHAQADWSGVTFKAVPPGTDGNAISIQMQPGQNYGEALAAQVQGNNILVSLPTAASENEEIPFCSVAQVVAEIQSVAGSLVTVSGAVNSTEAVISGASFSLADGGVYKPATTVGEVLAAASNIQAVVQLSGSDHDQVMQVGAWQLTGGVDGVVQTSTADVATLLLGGVASSQLTVTGSGDPLVMAQPETVTLSGGGVNCQSTTTAGQLVTLLNSTPAVTALMTVTGSGETLVTPADFQPLSGGTPRASISEVGEVVSLLNATPTVAALITVSGSGEDVVSDEGALLLNGGREAQSISTVNEVVTLLSSTSAVTTSMTVTGSGTTVLLPTLETLRLAGGGIEYTGTGITTYAWDVPGRLASVTLPTGQMHSYDYDYRTRRIGTHQTAQGPQVATHTAILFSGGLSLAEYESSTAQTTLSSPGGSTVRYVRGPDMGGGVGGLLYSSRNGESKYNLSNGRGDIVAQSDASASLTWTASYEAYGKRTKETGSNADKQRANSKDEDPTGLLNEGFRYRDIETGVWLSRDPAGFVDGPNLYAYVMQNPWTAFDPLGLWEAVPVPVNAPFMEKMALTWENAKRGFSSLPSDLRNGFSEIMSDDAIRTTFIVSNAPIAVVMPDLFFVMGTAAEESANKPNTEITESSKKRHSRKSEYPHGNDKNVRKRVLEANTNSQGQVIDPQTGEVIPKSEVTIEHKRAVVDHYNEEGYNQTAKERATWYNDENNLTVKRKKQNSSEGAKMKKTYRQDVGPAYAPKTPKPPRAPKPAPKSSSIPKIPKLR